MAWWSFFTASTCFLLNWQSIWAVTILWLLPFYHSSCLNQCWLKRWLIMYFMCRNRAVKIVSYYACSHLQFAARSTSIVKPIFCIRQTYHSLHSIWHELTCANLHRKLHLPILMEFQYTHGLLGSHGGKFVTSEMKFCHFTTIPSTVKGRPFWHGVVREKSATSPLNSGVS